MMAEWSRRIGRRAEEVCSFNKLGIVSALIACGLSIFAGAVS